MGFDIGDDIAVAQQRMRHKTFALRTVPDIVEQAQGHRWRGGNAGENERNRFFDHVFLEMGCDQTAVFAKHIGGDMELDIQVEATDRLTEKTRDDIHDGR